MRMHADRMDTSRLAFLLAALAIVFASAAQAQYSEDFGAYRVRYSALPTATLLPDVAHRYAIVRSDERGYVNIAVQRIADGDGAPPIRATVSGTASPLDGAAVPLRFREIVEDGAVYYIGEFPVSPPDTYRFSLSVTPEGATSPYLLKFHQDFVAD